MQEAPIHQSHVYGRIKILWTIFEKVHPRNIPVKLFQNRTCGFWEEDFFKNFFMSVQCKKPPFTRACLGTDQNFAKNEHSCEIISKSDQGFQTRRFLKNWLKNSISLSWEPQFWWNQILWTVFEEDLLRNIPAKFGPNWPRGLGGEDV